MGGPLLVPKVSYQREGLGDDVSFDDLAVRDLFVTNRIAEAIESWYPGHFWAVKVSHASGVVLISIPALMGMSNQYVIWLRDLKSDPGLKCVMRACGEILERFKMPRSRLSFDDMQCAMEAIPLHRRPHGVQELGEDTTRRHPAYRAPESFRKRYEQMQAEGKMP